VRAALSLRVVTLDAGGTLIAVAEPVGVTYARIAARHGLRVSADTAERGFHDAFAEAPPLAFPADSPARLRDRERRWWRAIVGRAIGPGPKPALDAAFDELFAHYTDAGAWRVFPEVPGALATLRDRGLRLAVVSNFDGRLAPLIDALGVGRLVDAVVHSSSAGSAKPDPGIFRIALARLGVEPADALHAGDEPLEDVEGARRAGMRALLVDRRRRAPAVPSGVPVLSSLATLPDAIGNV
jgi:putative hydrolase of the HAD superfamily